MNQKLIAFLKENDAYDAFVKNLEDKVCNGAGVKYLYPNPAKTLILRAFVWEYTPQGYDFWYALSGMWECNCNKKKEE